MGLIKLLFNTGLVSIISYIVNLYVINKLGPNDYGEFAYLLLVVSFCSLFILFSTDITSCFIREEFKCVKIHFGSIISIRFINLVIVAVVVYFFKIYELIHTQHYLYIYILLISVFNLSFYFETVNNNLFYSKVYLFEKLVYAVLVFSLGFLVDLNVGFIVAALFFSQLLSVILQWLYKASYENFDITHVTKNNINYLYSINLPFFITAIIMTGYGTLTRFYLNDQVDSVEFGIFSAAWQFVTLGIIAQTQVDKFFRKDIVKAILDKEYSEIIKCLKKYFSLVLMPLLLLIPIVVYFAESITSILFIPEYSSVSGLLPYICFYYIVICLDGLNKIFWSTRSSKKTLLIVHSTSVITYSLTLAIGGFHSLQYSLMCLVLFQFFAIIFLLIYFFVKDLRDENNSCRFDESERT